MKKNNLSPSEFKVCCNRAHAVKRVRERYGLEWNVGHIQKIEKKIRDGEAMPVGLDDKHPERVRYAVVVDNKWMVFVYDGATKSIITVLPPYVAEHYKHAMEPNDIVASEAATENLTLESAEKLLKELTNFEQIEKLEKWIERVKLENKVEDCGLRPNDPPDKVIKFAIKMIGGLMSGRPSKADHTGLAGIKAYYKLRLGNVCEGTEQRDDP